MINYRKKALNDVFKNAHIATLSIDVVLSKVCDKELKKELLRQKKGYMEFLNKIKSYAKNNAIKLKDSCGFKKFFMRLMINCNLLFNKSRNHVATIMIKGTVMGVTELYAMKNEAKNLSEEETALLEELLNLEEEYEKSLKSYL